MGPMRRRSRRRAAATRRSRITSRTRWLSCLKRARSSAQRGSPSKSPQLQTDYAQCWQGLRSHFTPDNDERPQSLNDHRTIPALQELGRIGQSGRQPTFPIQNLPFAVFRRAGSARSVSGRRGDRRSDPGPGALHDRAASKGSAADALAACAQPTLNGFMALGSDAWSTLARRFRACSCRGPQQACAA